MRDFELVVVALTHLDRMGRRVGGGEHVSALDSHRQAEGMTVVAMPMRPHLLDVLGARDGADDARVA